MLGLLPQHVIFFFPPNGNAFACVSHQGSANYSLHELPVEVSADLVC